MAGSLIKAGIRTLFIEQYAKDVVDLLKYLSIAKANFFGESYGGYTAALIVVCYPEFVRRVATYAATFGAPEVALMWIPSRR